MYDHKWPENTKFLKQMTNEVGRSLFAKAGELGAPVGITMMKVKGAFLYWTHTLHINLEYSYKGYNGTLRFWTMYSYCKNSNAVLCVCSKGKNSPQLDS